MSVKVSIGGNIMGRWSMPLNDTDAVKIDASGDIPTIYTKFTDTWATWYTNFIQDRRNQLALQLKNLTRSNKWVTSINGVNNIDTRLFILAGNCINIENSGAAITLVDISVESVKRVLDTTDYQGAIDKLMRCQMCIYHFLNKTLHRMLNTDDPCGLYYRYLGLQARWNAYVYGSKCHVSVFSTDSGVCIDVGYVNVACTPADVVIDVRVTMSTVPDVDIITIPLDKEGKKKISVHPISLHSLYLEGYGGEKGEHRIMRGAENVTDPYASKWGTDIWSNGSFHTKVEGLAYGKYSRFVYAIRKNSNALGTYRCSTTYFGFTLDITVTANGVVVYENTETASCAVLEYNESSYVPT